MYLGEAVPHTLHGNGELVLRMRIPERHLAYSAGMLLSAFASPNFTARAEARHAKTDAATDYRYNLLWEQLGL